MSVPNSRNQESFCVSKLRILADSTRLSVLRTLMDEPKNVSDLMAIVGVEQSLLSHHLGVLRDAGLVIANRCGKNMLYHLAPGVEGESVICKTINLGCCQLTFDDLHQGISEK